MIKNSIYYYLLLMGFSLFIFLSCATNGQTSKSKGKGNNKIKMSDKYQEVAKQKFANNISYLFNADTTFVLCIKDKKGTAKQTQNNLQFFAYDLTKEEIVYEKTIGAGTVSWFDKDRIALFYLPGIMRNDQTQDDYTTLYNIKTKKEINKKVFLTKKN